MKKVLYLLSLVLLVSCGTEKKKDEVKNEKQELVKPKVIAVNYPLQYFAERIGGDLIETEYLIPSDVDPAYWVPQDTELTKFQNADIILANGADYAKWMNNVSLPSSTIVNTTANAQDKLIEVAQGPSHSHGNEGEHVHMGMAFTTWLNFEIAQAQALVVKEALLKKLSQEKQVIEQNFNTLNTELQQLHTEMIGIEQKLKGVGIVGSHPVYQYLAQGYGLKMTSVHFEPGEMPSKKQWHDFNHEISHHPTKIMLWEDEPLAEVRAKLEAKGIKIVVFKPCGNRPSQGDFISVMKKNVEGLKVVELE